MMNLPAVYDRAVEDKEKSGIQMRNLHEKLGDSFLVNEIWNNKDQENRLKFQDLWEAKWQILRLGCTYGFAVQSILGE